MAAGTVSALEPNQWQLITSTAASGASITFNTLSGYKTLMIVGQEITKSASDIPAIRVNGDTTNGRYATMWSGGYNPAFLFARTQSLAQACIFRIYDCDKAVPHKVDCSYDMTVADGQPNDGYTNPVAVTSLEVFNIGASTFTGGTFYIYGIAS